MAMSLLYKRKWKQLTMIQRPSPKHNRISAGFARSLSENPDFLYRTKCFCIEGISLFIFRVSLSPGRSMSIFRKKWNAGMTVEAAVVLPLFLFFFLNICSAIEIIRLHGNLELALWDAGNRLTIYGHALTDNQEANRGDDTAGAEILESLAGVALSYGYVRNQLINFAGEEYLNNAPLTNGAAGLQFLESTVRDKDYLEIIVTYGVSSWNTLVPFRSFRMANRYYGHIWNGYCLPGEKDNAETRLETVYITKYGTIYHEKKECSYINLSISQVSLETAIVSENKWGERYEACGLCAREEPRKVVFITESGGCYHYSEGCSGLKRIITSVTRREAEEKGYGACRRCSFA